MEIRHPTSAIAQHPQPPIPNPQPPIPNPQSPIPIMMMFPYYQYNIQIKIKIKKMTNIEVNAMMKDLDKIYNELKEDQECKNLNS